MTIVGAPLPRPPQMEPRWRDGNCGRLPKRAVVIRVRGIFEVTIMIYNYAKELARY
jgi:hypothetical protein